MLHTPVIETQQNLFVTALVFSYHCKIYFPFGKSVQNLPSDFKMKALFKSFDEGEIPSLCSCTSARYTEHAHLACFSQVRRLHHVVLTGKGRLGLMLEHVYYMLQSFLLRICRQKAQRSLDISALSRRDLPLRFVIPLLEIGHIVDCHPLSGRGIFAALLGGVIGDRWMEMVASGAIAFEQTCIDQAIQHLSCAIGDEERGVL